MEPVKPERLCAEIEKAVREYSSDVELAIASRLDKTADQIIDYIKEHAPRSGSGGEHLADTFAKQSYGDGADKTIVIYSKSKGQIVHLVELGFRHRSGKLVAARPFMRPAYEQLTPKMLDDIEKIIEEGSE